MAYLGLKPIQQALSTAHQTLSGDGSSLEFVLQQAVGKASDIIVVVGGTIQRPEVDYTASGTTLLFTAGNAPANLSNNISITFIGGALSTITLTANAFPVGSNVQPSIRSVTAASTGIYWPSLISLGLTVSGNTRVVVSDQNAGVATSASTGALRVSGGLGVTGTVYTGGDIVITSGTASTNSDEGALIVSGGVGASGDFYLGGTMTISGGLTVAGAFNTTSTNSLTVNTPFVFLANTNVGDAIDQGFVGTYNDGTQRYTGLVRTQSDGRYKLFTNLTNQPSTLVDVANVSYRYADLWFANANVTSTINSTSTLTGALVTGGGVGIAKDVYIGGGIGAGGTLGSNGQFLQSTGSGLTWTNLSASKINQDASNVAVTTSYVNVAVNGSNVASFGATRLLITTDILPSANNTSNIGSVGAVWNTVHAKATSAQYADLAEKYLADAAYDSGTVVDFGGLAEVTASTEDMSVRVAGVVSTQPGYIMNEGLTGENVVTLALTGRVPTKVVGPIKKGDMLVSNGDGRARAEILPRTGSVIGKAIENFDGEDGVIEVVVGRI